VAGAGLKGMVVVVPAFTPSQQTNPPAHSSRNTHSGQLPWSAKCNLLSPILVTGLGEGAGDLRLAAVGSLLGPEDRCCKYVIHAHGKTVETAAAHFQLAAKSTLLPRPASYHTAR
jgi:hypothetical protein